MNDKREGFEGWCILELMGHRRLAGRCSEAVIAGAAFIRLDIPKAEPIADGKEYAATQFYSGSAIYCITPTTEEIARAVAARTDFSGPVTAWEMRQLGSGGASVDDDGRDDDEPNDDDF